MLSTRSRLSKLKAMSAGEIAHRISYNAFLAMEWAQHTRGHNADPRRVVHGLAAGLSRRSDWQDALLVQARSRPAAFFPSAVRRDEMQRLFTTAYAGERDSARRDADLAMSHTVEFFGSRFTYGKTIDWHADPVTGQHWPREFHARVPVRSGDSGFGDVKYVWELNRHQFLIDLAKGYFIDDRGACAAETRALVLDWIQQNPYGTGVSWGCALEPAFRVFSWLWAYFLSLDDPELDAEAHAAWVAGFHDHGTFLYRHLELYASPFNHLIGEASALYALGLLFPQFRDAPLWRRRGREVLESRVGDQFHTDGGSVEQSTFYHHATLGFYLQALVLGRLNSDPFSRTVDQAVERAIHFSMHMMQPDGRLPAVGGADDGKPIRMEHRPLWDFRHMQALGAVLFDRPDFKFAAGRFHEDALWLLGPDGLDRFNAMESSVPTAARALPDSGYFVFRSDWTARADYLVFDCGTQAGGVRTDGIPSAIHGHADCLSVMAWLGGTPVFVDSGFFCYNGPREWEVGFRKTSAHNTACIDARDQSKHVSRMAWANAFTPRQEGWQTDGRHGWAMGSHDGYARGATGVTHRRIACLRPGGYIVLLDEFTGSGEHLIDVNYQFPPGVEPRFEGNSLRWADFEMSWASGSGIARQLRCGGPDPDDGWVATSLGVRHPAPKLTLTLNFHAPKTILATVVADLRVMRGSSRVSTAAVEPCSPGALAMVVQCPEYDDWLIAGGELPARVGPFESDARLSMWRSQNGLFTDPVWIGGTYATAAPVPSAHFAMRVGAEV
jgi:hypothetical protein